MLPFTAFWLEFNKQYKIHLNAPDKKEAEKIIRKSLRRTKTKYRNLVIHNNHL